TRRFSVEPAFFDVIKFQAGIVFGDEAFVVGSDKFEFGLQSLESWGCQMFVTQGFQSGGGQAQLGRPMTVFFFEAIESFQNAREIAAAAFGNFFRGIEFRGVGASSSRGDGLILRFAQAGPELLISIKVVLM